MKKNLVYFLLLVTANCFGQAAAPVINSVQPLNSGILQKIVITGTGFSATASQNQVWFDHVVGTVTAATAFSLEVTVPARARYSNIEVINIATGLSAKSNVKFLPSYGGAPFDIAKTKLVKIDSSNIELFDIASADFDLDGDLDMVSTRGGVTATASTPATDIYVYQNTSTGIGNIKFTRTSLTATYPTSNVACGDLNGDGKPDIVATRSGGSKNEVFIWKNTNSAVGTVSFAPKVTKQLDVSQVAFRVAIRDLDGNGLPELIVSNANGDAINWTQIYVFPNISSGGTILFGTPIKLTVTGAVSTYGIDVQDLDGDSKPDIIVNQFKDKNLFIFRNISTGASPDFAPVQTIISDAIATYNNLTTCDLNKDGLLDIIATSTDRNVIDIWINASTPGSISFPTSKSFATSKGPWGVDVADMDGDGDEDIIVANYNAVTFDPTDTKLNIFLQDGLLSFTRVDFNLVDRSRNLRVGDYDGDGKPDIAFTQLASPPTGTSYHRVTVIRNQNCWAPVITGPSTKICAAQTVPLKTQPALGVTYDWKFNGTSQGVNASTYNATGALGSGTYTVTVTGTFDTSCGNTSPGYAMTVDNASAFPNDPVITPGATPCVGSPLSLTASVSPAPPAGAIYTWTGPNNYSASTVQPTANVVVTSSATTKNVGAYTVQVALSTGCKSNVASKTIDVYSVPLLPVAVSPGLISCIGDTVKLSVGTGYTYQWKKGGVAISPAETNNQLILNTVTAANQADYSVLVTSSNGCSLETNKASLQIYTAPAPDFSFPSPACKGVPINFTDLTPPGDSRGTFSYSWNFGDGGNSTLASPTHTYTGASGFTVQQIVSYVGTSSYSCSPKKTKTITIVNAPLLTFDPTPAMICSGDLTTLSVTNPSNFTSFVWSGGVTGNTSSVSITQPNVQYTVTTTDPNNCVSTNSITIPSKPLISPFKVKAGRLSISPGDTTQLTATAGADTYLWSPAATLSNAAISNPIAKPTSATTYTVVATKAGSCDATDFVTVDTEQSEANINPPILFSPNGDKVNDCWKFCTGQCGSTCAEEATYSDWTMTIFDGHGSLVYQQKGFKEWDGGSAPDGVYYYVFSNSHGKPKTGSVLLVRQK